MVRFQGEQSRQVGVHGVHVISPLSNRGSALADFLHDLGHTVNPRARGFVVAYLEQRIYEEIGGVQLVTFAADVHAHGVAGCGNGGQIRLNVLLPDPQAGEDVRWHVQRMRGRRGDGGIAPGRIQAQMG